MNIYIKGGEIVEWYDWTGKEIFVKLNSGSVYSGTIKKVSYIGKNEFDVDLFMIEIIDKFGAIVCFSSNEIKLIKEEELK